MAVTTTFLSAPGDLAFWIEAVERADTADALLEATSNLATVLAFPVAAEGVPCLPPKGPAPEQCATRRKAIDSLIQVLGFNNPGASVAAVDGLIAIGSAAVEPLLAGLDENNYGARAWAVRALAGIGDLRGLELLEQAAVSDVGPSVRRAAARGLGFLQLKTLPRDERERMRERCLRTLLKARSDGEWVVRYAVAVALENLATALKPEAVQRRWAQSALEDMAIEAREPIPVVRMRADLAMVRLQRSSGERR